MLQLSGKTSGRLESACRAYCRQRLPRPARLYSTPTRKAEAPAVATARAPPPLHEFPVEAFPSSSRSTGTTGNVNNINDIQSFLHRRMQYTLVPTPLPDDRTSPLNNYYFTDSSTQDSLAVIDACLHNSYNVPRAKDVFERLRLTRQGDPILHPRLYNLFLQAYLEMAGRDSGSRATWLREAWALYGRMESEVERVTPNASTYATMLLTWMRYNTDAEYTFVSLDASDSTPAKMLQCMINRQISVLSVVGDKLLTPKEASGITEHLSRAAAQEGLTHVIKELGQVETIAADPLAGVPEIIPVVTRKAIPLMDDLADDLESEHGQSRSEQTEVPFNLDSLRKHLAEVAYARKLLPDDASARQKLLEASVYDVAIKRLQRESQKLEDLGLNSNGLNQEQLQRWMFEWHGKLKKRLEKEIAVIKETEAKASAKKSHPTLGEFVSLLKPQKLSLITILELMRLHGTGGISEGMKTARAILTVGKAIEVEYKAEVLKKNNLSIPQAPSPHSASYFTKRALSELASWRKAAQTYDEDSTDWTSDWTHATRARVGSILVDCLMDVATVKRTAIDKRTGKEIEEDHPAFYHSYEYLRGRKLGVIRLNNIVAERLSKENLEATLHPRHLPMLVKPKPWLSHDNGGYLFNKNSVMRMKDTQEQLVYLRHASNRGNMELIYAGLDVLGSTPWKINRAVFDVVLEVWNSQQRFGKLPPAVYDEPEPVKPDNYDTDQDAKSRFMTNMKAWQREKANNHSLRCSVNYKVEIARAFLSDSMYFPHNIDFRGRAYPVPPHLSHIGDDLSRGLMVFAETRPLGASGLRWLKIHLANLYGYDKASFEERVEFVHKHLDDIYDSAEKPLEGRRWWAKADDPWQCLAACIELRKALESGDPEAYESCQPVHQDGTCNGLQHYAALGGDAQGARQVNLAVTDRPSDVYTHVANMVEEGLAKDIEEKDHKYAKMLKGKIARKVVKQTVMTTVYGVTFIGARAQIEKQLRDRKDVPADEAWAASSYLAKKVMSSIGDLFSGARDIQHWLSNSARLIARSIPSERIASAEKELSEGVAVKRKAGSRLAKEQMTTVVWTTPLGLPIAQPYRKTKRKQIMTSIQTVYISDPNSPAEVNAAKQASAFPPNFIHSLDATHMMLTALECRTQGLTFASVHDSYWTHAATVEKMNTIIRDTFIALHESDVLQKLHDEFIDRYKDYKVSVFSLRSGGVRLSANAATAVKAATASIDESDKEAVAEAEAVIKSIESGEVADEAEMNTFTSADSDLDDEWDTHASPEDTADLPSSETTVKTVRSRNMDGKATPTKEKSPKQATAPKVTDKSLGMESSAFMRGSYVNLVDILPPLPKKGHFDVKTIKNSLYFFS